MKRKFFKWTVLLIAGYFLVFGVRLWYGYRVKNCPTCYQSSDSDYEDESSFSIKNYAREKKFEQKEASVTDLPADATPVSGDIVYEKKADLQSKTVQFENDESKARNVVSKYKGVIQFEKKSGNPGDRKLYLTAGVIPDRFDSAYSEMSKIGEIRVNKVSKTDKTSEMLQLKAKITSLEKIRNSLSDLKSKSGKIDEYINLENRILEIEEELQDMGVSMGSFDAENQFCTINFSLIERKTPQAIALSQRIMVATEWSLNFYLKVLLMAGLILVCGDILSRFVKGVVYIIRKLSSGKN
jgi:hypothetical protein